MPTHSEIQFHSALSTQTDLETASRELNNAIRAQSAAPFFDLALVFFTPHYARVGAFLAENLRRDLTPRVLLGCTSEGVIGKTQEIENEPAIALVVAQLPGVTITPFILDAGNWDEALGDVSQFEGIVDAPLDAKIAIMIGDPFSTPMDDVLRAFNAHYPGLPVIGGMASGAQHSHGNALILNERVHHQGAIGVTLAGNFDVDVIVSQGCRPIGKLFRVSAARENFLLRLENESALAQIQKLISDLSPPDRELLRNGLFVGRAIDSTKDALGRGDFLIRGVMGADQNSGAVAIGDVIAPGETIQFHLRDQVTAEEDLAMMLMPQSLDAPPRGALLFSCNGRGTRLYDHPNGDISIIQKILGGVNLAGFFCAGEIGPIGGKNFLHGHTASMVLFRPHT
ncbi:MAG: FIST C-terminal domain-containing protein [Chloroflexi bacterium]|nr:FIST C-terminal domain-containing protein [Chloroflexota bacterium]